MTREVQSVMTKARLRGGAPSQDLTHLTSKESNGLDLRQLCPLKKALFEQRRATQVSRKMNIAFKTENRSTDMTE